MNENKWIDVWSTLSSMCVDSRIYNESIDLYIIKTELQTMGDSLQDFYESCGKEITDEYYL